MALIDVTISLMALFDVTIKLINDLTFNFYFLFDFNGILFKILQSLHTSHSILFSNEQYYFTSV